MKSTLIAAAIAAASLTPVAASAQAAAASAVAPTVGAKVYGPEGNEVGTVESVNGSIVVVNTGVAKGGLPLTSFAMREKGLTIGYTKAQLETALGAAAAASDQKLDAALVVDGPVKSSDNVMLGTISKVEGDDVTIALVDGASVALKKQSFGLAPDGSLKIGMTADALKAALQPTPAAPATDAPATDAPATDAPATDAPTEAPAAEAPAGT